MGDHRLLGDQLRIPGSRCRGAAESVLDEAVRPAPARAPEHPMAKRRRPRGGGGPQCSACHVQAPTDQGGDPYRALQLRTGYQSAGPPGSVAGPSAGRASPPAPLRWRLALAVSRPSEGRQRTTRQIPELRGGRVIVKQKAVVAIVAVAVAAVGIALAARSFLPVRKG